ncbi:DUF6298 domain-containing protein [Desertivirga xinjiangensis]|uniref:DUF6298 domain-containing protein n=1 Tax=Desertivirga xinjiangensis TaxID=539206 RepID=UPI00210CF28F|nr:DUF6298 domain-containing protein [Pedobacter xinjiangensis]
MKYSPCPGLILLFLALCIAKCSYSQNKVSSGSPVHITEEGKLIYNASENGDRVPDYSYCGYKNSNESIPNIPVKVIVPAAQGDATSKIQAAIDYVSSLPINKQGFRGTVLIESGTYEIAGSLHIRKSGVVLRGSGTGKDGTTLLATGVDRETLIKVVGQNDKKLEKPVPLQSVYFPVNSSQLIFGESHQFKVGDEVVINRPSTKEWIQNIGADKIGTYVNYHLTHWAPGDFDQNWLRKVVAVSPRSITLNIPLTNSLDPLYGGGKVSKYQWKGRINNVGVENLRCVSTFDHSNEKDENHRWMAISVENVRDAWVRRVTAEHFVSSAVAIWETASAVTVEDCKSLAPVGEIGNHRRFSFHNLGQQVLFQRCYAEFGYHDFSVGFTAPGPNAFVQCYSYLPFSFSGTIGGWSTGVLFDKTTVDGGNIFLDFRDVDGQGGGWTTANSLSWQSRAAKLYVSKPPQAQNWAYGSWAQGYGNGFHERPHSFLKPESFYYAQLEARTGKKSVEQEKILVYESSGTSAPSPDVTAKYSERSKSPDQTMETWIDTLIARHPIPSDLRGAKKLAQIKAADKEQFVGPVPSIEILNGWILRDKEVLTGRKSRTSLWKGTTRPSDLADANMNLLRFVPGRTGKGLTDDLDSVVSMMQKNNIVSLQSFPALWYERRRDDHARSRRADADVWSPFYEQPFSRSGQGEAFDRLSKYDLTKWNPWYWLRLKKFADLADQNGLVFIEEHYLQHNIIEEGAHWADYPWRTANNINNTGFAENPAYAGDKRIYMGVEFYDTTNVVRNRLHRNYIRKCLENFKDNKNIIHHLGLEYTGPVHFVQFWLDVISEWEREHKKRVLVMLPGTKDVQDAILSDPVRSRIVDIVEVIQWHYRKDGSLYAPAGGQSLTERQYARIFDVGESSMDQVYRAVKEFHLKYPEKAIVYSRGGGQYANWASFMGGGSLTSVPVKDKSFLKAAAEMDITTLNGQVSSDYVLGKKGKGYILVSKEMELKLTLPTDEGTYQLNWINASTGEIIRTKKQVSKYIELQAPFKGPAVLWLSK